MSALSLKIDLHSLVETERLGLRLGELARAGDVIILNGSLGAGKTTMAQFIGAGLGVPADCYITSPTYSLMHEYQGRLLMYHLDLYRLATEEEIEDLGFLDNIYGEGVAVIEWADRLGSLMPADYLAVELAGQEQAAEARTARISCGGDQWRDRLRKISKPFPG
jgi:tRNA threonylcarbamoyladenosine biosynthesis protein TsaE